MVRDVVTASPETTATGAATLLRDERVSSVVVVRDGEPVGIITEGDFATHLCESEELGRLELAEVMSEPLTTIASEASIVDAVGLLRANEIEHLPVVDAAGELVGIVTTTELSYYVPQLVHPTRHRETEPPRRQVRTDTSYEHDEWTFAYHGEDETTVSEGDVARFSKTITEADVASFAEVTGDTNRLHLDADYAAETRFGQPIVHGVLALGVISAALARLPGLTIYLSQESSFLGPIPIGDRVTARCEIVEALGGAKFRIETSVESGDGEVVLEGDAVVLVDEVPPEATIEGEATA